MSEAVAIAAAHRILGDTLEGAPELLKTPDERPSLAEARLWCKTLAGTHYENFHVATWFLPVALRPHFESVYSYCRVSDDLGDEIDSPAVALRLLDTWGEMLGECYAAPERSRHPVFVALHETIVACDLPQSLFADLLDAFRQDQIKTRYATWDEAIEYSRRSANPVGRLVLQICGYCDEVQARLSDHICTGLQLANFWQDLVEDAERGRRYLPQEYLDHFGVDEGQIEGRVFTPEFRAMMEALVLRTRALLTQGAELSGTVDRQLAVTLDLFRKGGEAILDGIAAQGYDTLRGRPVVTRRKKAQLLVGALVQRARRRLGRCASPGGRGTIAVTTAEAFRQCRIIARREAKNFFWAFRVLPQAKSDAMCAVYAFMRKADDLSDDETMTLEERRQALAAWVARWRGARSGEATEDAVFVAMEEVQRRFGISDALLEELLEGVTLDLVSDAATREGLQTYTTFDDLYRYCYLVASVVGLVSIRIFGYDDSSAERLAEETGLAFQLTNILRDVKEDLERGRVYLPLELLDEDGVPLDRLRALAAGSEMSIPERAMLATFALRAENLYQSGRRLLPLVHRDSRAALWVLIEIYHRLLSRMAAREMDVFSDRVSVAEGEKMVILARGAMMALRNRVGL